MMDWLGTLILGIVLIAIGYIVNRVFSEPIIQKIGYVIMVIGVVVVVIAIILLAVMLLA